MKAHKGVAWTVAAAILISGGIANVATAEPASAAISQEAFDAAVERIVSDTNAARADAGLPPLRAAATIHSVAHAWSGQMAAEAKLYHNPSYTAQMPAGWRSVAENVAWGYSAQSVVDAWMNSEGHRTNILGDFTHIGIGFQLDDTGRPWATQNFAKYPIPDPTPTTPQAAPTATGFTATWQPASTAGTLDYQVELRAADGTLLETRTTALPTASFSGLRENTRYTLSVLPRATDAAGLHYAAPATTIDVTTLGPLTAGVPTVAGTPKVGQTLTAASGEWAPAGVELSYQWLADGAQIPGATGHTLVLAAAQEGQAITVAVTGTKAGYRPATTTSLPTAPVAAVPALSGPAPTVTGEAAVGKTLTAEPGDWSAGVSLAYQWFADGTPIAGATGSTLTLRNTQLNKVITVRVTGSKDGFLPATVASAPTAKVAWGTLTATPPVVSGTAEVGRTLTMHPGVWGPVGVMANYQWKADGANIPGATKSSLALLPAHAGALITVTVVGLAPGYTVTSRTSEAVRVAVPVAAPAPGTNPVVGTYTIPAATGVDYLVGGILKAPGTYPSGYTTVTVTAAAQPGYSLTGTASWTLKLSRIAATAAKPAANATTRTVTIPKLAGVAYTINGAAKGPGAHKVSTPSVKVAAQASAANYAVAAKTWTYDLRTSVRPADPTFSAAANTVRIPATAGVRYYIGGVLKKAGTHRHSGAGTVTAKAASGWHKLTGTTSWRFDNRNSTAATRPVFNARANTVAIPSKTGVAYYVNGQAKRAGTHRYTGKVTVTVKPSSAAYRLVGTQRWAANL